VNYLHCHRPTSTTTRIKTVVPHLIEPNDFVTDQLPPQQGLRQKVHSSSQSRWSCHRPTSTTTRIKTADSTPLFKPTSGHRPTSTTTRIKTYEKFIGRGFLNRSQTNFHYNKD